MTATIDVRDAVSLSDDDEDIGENHHHIPEYSGLLSKWTNYIHGWQDRYFVLKDGTLSYFKSESEISFGCRGALGLAKSVVIPHEFDECRLDVAVNDCIWYLRAISGEERQQWMDILELHKQSESGYGSENSLRRHGSVLSVASGSGSLSMASASSYKRSRGLREKLAEMETFRDILCRQADTLQNYFDACNAALAHYNQTDHMESDDIDDLDDVDAHNLTPPVRRLETFSSADDSSIHNDLINILQQHGAHAIDFKGESCTFKATTAGILATLSHCIDLMSQQEETWRKKVQKEIDKRKKVEDAYKVLAKNRPKAVASGGPDYEEGPYSLLKEDEFYDAIETAYDKLERGDEEKVIDLTRVKKPSKSLVTSLDPLHPLYTEVNRVVTEHVTHADMTASDVANSWTLVMEDGEMKVYKKESPDKQPDALEPHKAVHTIKGITGHELCHYFWDPSVRLEWDSLLESTQVVEYYSKDTVAFYQTHRRVWPSSQRDSLFWSTIRHCPSDDDDGPDYWIVVNHSTEHKDAPNNPKCVRLWFNVAMICQTVVDPPGNGQEISRDNLTCRIQYSAIVDPGGWAPMSVIKLISKRELPKFLRTFTAYVQQKTKDLPIMF